ncbi:DHH family phosphoesterase [Halorientalis litorea]|uniref:DHH family phosphoesterase n=1 Tax=Halorientalis litorea TaxID=2931977 RepID=UPI001FF1F7A5|nr:DHHA1 domain-containing protein [Halorientalis litorea]
MPLVAASGVGPVGTVGVETAVDATAAFALENPLVAVSVAAVVLVVVVVIGLLVRWLRRSAGERFHRALAARDEVAVLMHPNPDPDAMACALAVQTLATAVDTEATMQYAGQIRHQENRAFETVLDLNFDRITDANDIAAEEVVAVDHNTPRGFPGAETVEPFAVVDHHPGNGSGDVFTDVRTDTGACATIFAEYYDALGWEPAGSDADDETTLPSDVATALVYGIQSDTNNLTAGCSAAEFDAAAYLYDGVDEDTLDRIANPEVDAEVLDVKARAIVDREVRNAFAFSNVGEVNNADAIPQAADELLRLEGVTAVVVAGEKDGTVHLSGRSRDDRVHMGKTLQAAVDDIPMADAGGHARMGGGQISLDHMEGLGPSTGVTMPELTDRLFSAMSGDI